MDRQKELMVDNRGTAFIEQQGMEHGLELYPTALTAGSCLGRNSGIIFASDMGGCLRTFPRPVMVVVRSSRFLTPYHAQMVALFWRGMMTLKRSGAPLDPGPLPLVLLPMNLK